MKTEKILKLSFIFVFIAVIPYLYFFVRDIRAVAGTSTENRVDGCYPHDLVVVPDRFSSHIEWKTESECVGYIRLGLNNNLLEDGQAVFSEIGVSPSTQHAVEIENLKPGTQYYFGVISNDELYGEEGQAMVLRTLD